MSRRDRPFRVLLVEPNLHDNGALRVSLDRAARWRDAGAEVTVFVVFDEDHGSPVAVPDGLRVIFTTSRPVRIRWILPLAVLRSSYLAARVDVVVAGREIGDGLLLAALASRVTHRPMAVTVQSAVGGALADYVPPRLRAVTRAALVRAPLAVPVAAGLVPGLIDLGLPADRAHVVTNGVDVAGVRTAAARAPGVALPSGPLVVGTGRLTQQKGFDLLIRAHAAVLAAGGPPHQVMVLGEGPDRADLDALAASLGVGASVHLAGFTDNPHAVVSRADLFVLPSRWEGYPLGLVEAQCCAVPSLAANCVSGPAEVLEGGRFGALVPVEDVDALAAAITAHLLDPAPLADAARDGALLAEDRFDASRAADRHLALLTTLADHRTRDLPASREDTVHPQTTAATAENPASPWPATVASFDVFDTLITRTVGDPKAVFGVLARDLRAAGVLDVDATVLTRSRDDVEARQLALFRRPPRIEEIHRELVRVLGFPGELAEVTMAAELDVERRVTRPVPGAAARVAVARGAGDGPVVFVSDTPLPASFLQELLTLHGFWREGDALFTSADLGDSKSTGGLYRIVADALGVAPSRFHHTGDNVMSDVAAARVEGWTSDHTRGTGLNRYEKLLERYADATGGVTSSLAGASRLARLEATSAGRHPDMASVASGVAAPLLVGFCLWLLQQAELRGVGRLYFVSRDGEVLMQVVEPLAKAIGSPVECRYLYGSRRAWHLASSAAAEKDRDKADWLHVDSSHLTPRSFLARVGVSVERAHELTGDAMFQPPRVDRKLTAAERGELFALADHEALSAEIHDVATREMHLVLDYLCQEGLDDGTSCGLVDVGWLGKTGRSLDELMRNSGMRPIDAWFYIGLESRAGEYSGEFLGARQDAFIFDHSRGTGLPGMMSDVVALVETFCAGSHGTVRGFAREDDGTVVPVLAHPENTAAVQWGLPEFREVVRRTTEIVAGNGGLDGHFDLRGVLWDLLFEFWQHPTEGEVEAWGGFPYDTDSTPPQLPLVVPVKAQAVVQELRAGRMRLRHSNSWQAGTARVSAQPWKATLHTIAGLRRQRDRLERIPRRVRLERAKRSGPKRG